MVVRYVVLGQELEVRHGNTNLYRRRRHATGAGGELLGHLILGLVGRRVLAVVGLGFIRVAGIVAL